MPSISAWPSAFDTISTMPDSATVIARMRGQPKRSRIQIQASRPAMSGAVDCTTRMRATVAC